MEKLKASSQFPLFNLILSPLFNFSVKKFARHIALKKIGAWGSLLLEMCEDC